MPYIITHPIYVTSLYAKSKTKIQFGRKQNCGKETWKQHPKAMVVFQSGLPLFCQQFRALLWKNIILAKRNKRSTLIQLFASFIFVFLLFSIEKGNKLSYGKVTDPKVVASFPIPPCEHKAHIRKPCFDFVWSGNGSSTINTIVTAIMNNNPGRQIPIKKVLHMYMFVSCVPLIRIFMWVLFYIYIWNIVSLF